MIRVTVELVPGGDEDRKRTLSTMVIANDGSGTPGIGNYDGLLRSEYCDARPLRVVDFDRRHQSVWSLIGAFLKGWGHTRHSPKKIFKDCETPKGLKDKL